MSGAATQTVNFSNIAATTAAFALLGGKYALTVTATFGGGNVQLQILSLDGSTWLNVGSSVTTAGVSTNDIPAGQYRLSITTATAVFASVSRVPI